MKKLLSMMIIVVASFTLAACGRTSMYLIELSSNNSEAVLNITPDDLVEEGTEVTITASSVDGYTFVHWYDRNSENEFSTNASHTFTVNSDLRLRAIYEAEDSTDNGDPIVSDPAAESAKRVYEDFDNNMAHMVEVLSAMDSAEASTLHLSLTIVESIANGTTQTTSLNIEQRMVTNATTSLREMKFHIANDDIDTALRMIVEESEYFYTVYIDVSDIITAMQAQGMTLDVKEIFAVDQYVYVQLPKALVDEVYDEAMAMAFEMLAQQYGVDQEGFDLIMAEFDRFDKYFSMTYLDTHEHLDVEMAIVNDSFISTLMTMNSDMMHDFFEDVFKDIYAIAYMVVPEGELPDYETFIDSENYTMMLSQIDTLGDINFTMLYEPYTMDHFEMSIDFSDFLTSLNAEEMMNLVSLDFEMSWESEATIERDIDALENARNILDIGEEVAQMFVLFQALNVGNQVMMNETIADGTYSFLELEDHFIYVDFPMINNSLSSVTISTMDEVRTVDIELVGYNEEILLYEPIDYNTLNDLLADEPQTRSEALDILALINEEALDFEGFLQQLFEMMHSGPPEE